MKLSSIVVLLAGLEASAYAVSGASNRAHTYTATQFIDEICIERSAITYEELDLSCPPPVGISPNYIDYERHFNQTNARIKNIDRHFTEFAFDGVYLQRSIAYNLGGLNVNIREVNDYKSLMATKASLTNNSEVCSYEWVTATHRMAHAITDISHINCELNHQNALMLELQAYFQGLQASLEAYKMKECAMLSYIVSKIDLMKRGYYERIREQSCGCKREGLNTFYERFLGPLENN